MSLDFEETQKLPEIKDPLVVFNVLELELKRRLTLMKKRREQGLVKKYLYQTVALVSKPNSDEASLCGALFAKHFPTQNIKDCVRRLRLKPFDSKSRIKMLELLMKKKVNSVLIYREMLIHALLELSFSHISGAAVNTARKVQFRYLVTLAEFLKETLHSRSDAKNSKKEDSSASAQRTKLEKIHKQEQGMAFIMGCLSLFKAKRIEAKIDLDMNHFLIKTKFNDYQLGKALIPVLSSMAYLPIVRSSMEKWLLVSKNVFAETPLVYLYGAKMNRIRGKILLMATKTGDKRFLNDLLQAYSAAFNNANSGVVQVGDLVKSPIEKACIFEHSQISIEILSGLVPFGFGLTEKHRSQISKCMKLLDTLSREKGALALQAALMRALKHKKKVEDGDGVKS